ncbi:hypothetical protein CREGCYN_13220 [Synechococcus sp. M16CYN]
MIWLIEYKKYLDLVEKKFISEAELLRVEINETLLDIELSWEDFEDAPQNFP